MMTKGYGEGNMHKFFVEADKVDRLNRSIVITGSDVNHIKNVLRLNVADQILISDGRRSDYICTIDKIESDRVETTIVEKRKNLAELPTKLVLYQGMPKSDKMEFIVQKAVELGASRVVPVIMDRTVVKVDESKADKKVERYNSIALEAAKQCGRGIVPTVGPFMTFEEALKDADSLEANIVPYECAKGMGYTKIIMNSVIGKESLGIFIGPEGGFSDSEIELAKSHGAYCISLGNRILRTETAGLATLAIISFELDE